MSTPLQLPALLVLVVVASFVAALVHLWMGRTVRDLLLFCAAAVAGCLGGQLVGQGLGIVPWRVGQVHIVEAGAGALLVALVAAWLRPQRKRPGGPKP